jgi:hypothetical protein
MASAGGHIRGVTGKVAGSGINQTSFMFGAIVFAFLFFITTRGDLGKWLGLLGLANVKGKTAPATTPNLSQSSSITAPNNSAGLSLPGVPASQSNMLASASGSISGIASGLTGGAGGILGGLTSGSSGGIGDYASLAMLFA